MINKIAIFAESFKYNLQKKQPYDTTYQPS